jgi:hypothetical protein
LGAGLVLTPEVENDRLRQALVPFAFIGRKSMELLGLAEEYDHARDLLGLDWRCECGDLNRHHEAFCYRCGAGSPAGAS